LLRSEKAFDALPGSSKATDDHTEKVDKGPSHRTYHEHATGQQNAKENGNGTDGADGNQEDELLLDQTAAVS
jgi:hypothetical protein